MCLCSTQWCASVNMINMSVCCSVTQKKVVTMLLSCKCQMCDRCVLLVWGSAEAVAAAVAAALKPKLQCAQSQLWMFLNTLGQFVKVRLKKSFCNKINLGICKKTTTALFEISLFHLRQNNTIHNVLLSKYALHKTWSFYILLYSHSSILRIYSGFYSTPNRFRMHFISRENQLFSYLKDFGKTLNSAAVISLTGNVDI